MEVLQRPTLSVPIQIALLFNAVLLGCVSDRDRSANAEYVVLDSSDQPYTPLLIDSTVGAAQRSDSLSGNAAGEQCLSCTIAIFKTSTIGTGLRTAGGPVTDSKIGVTSKGDFIVGPTDDLSTISHFDRNGRLVKTLGRKGEGPGEYGIVNAVAVGAGDTIYAIDSRLARVTVLSPTGTVIRTIKIPASSNDEIVPISSSSVVVHALVPAGGSYKTVHRATAGRPTISFGSDTSRLTEKNYWIRGERELVRAQGGGIWTITSHRVYMERFTESGVRTHVLIEESANGGTPEAPPRIWDAWSDAQGRIWLIRLEVNPEFRAPAHQPRSRALSPSQMHDAWDTIIEVIDPGLGRMVARGKTDFFVGSFANDGRLVVIVEDSDGANIAQMWRATLLPIERGPS